MEVSPKTEQAAPKLAELKKSRSGLDSKSNNPVLETLRTRGEGDCAFHAILGVWNDDQKQVICKNIPDRRKTVAAAIKTDMNLRPLVLSGIQALIMSNRAIGPQTRQLQDKYQRFLDDQNGAKPDIWTTFAAELGQYSHIIQYITDTARLKQKEAKAHSDESARLRAQFYTALNHNDGELYARIFSLPALYTAFQDYNQRCDASFDWDGAISPAIIQEYAHFISEPGSWLLPLELKIIAHVFHVTVKFYTARATVEIFNPGEAKTVSVRFNGRDHYEQQVPVNRAAKTPVKKPASVPPSFVDSSILFAFPKRNLPRVTSPFSAKDWAHQQDLFLSAVDEILATGQIDQAIALHQELCQNYHNQPTQEWVFLWKKLHAKCSVLFTVAITDSFQPGNPHAALQAACERALPKVTPMTWHIECYEDKAAANVRTQALSSELAKSVGISGSNIHQYYLLYWGNQEESTLQFRLLQPDQKPKDVTFSELFSPRALPAYPDWFVGNLLTLLTLQDTVAAHPALTTEVQRLLWTHLQQQNILLPMLAEEKAKTPPSRIIAQSSGQQTTYYAQWYTLPAAALEPHERTPLPGRWREVYPEPTLKPVEIAESQGWVQLDQAFHTELLTLLVRMDAHQRRQLAYQQLTQLYAACEADVTHHSPVVLRYHWHTTLAQTAAQQPYQFPRAAISAEHQQSLIPLAITHGCAALRLYESSERALSLFPLDHPAFLREMEGWVLAKTRAALQALLPQYQAEFTRILAPLQRKTGKLRLPDFQAACQLLQQRMPLLLWLDPPVAQKIYNAFNQACQRHREDINAQIQALAALAKPTNAEQKNYQDWCTSLQLLFTQWDAAGYKTELTEWKRKLQGGASKIVQKPALVDVLSVEEQLLGQLKSGLPKINASHPLAADPQLSDAKIPASWKEAHDAAYHYLAQYQAYHRPEAFKQLKRRYGVRLRAYQLFCETLAETRPAYAPLAQWCKTQYQSWHKLTWDTQFKEPTAPHAWPWSHLRTGAASKLPPALWQQLCAHFYKLLPAPPAEFEIVLMQSTQPPTTWRLHILVADASHHSQTYFSVMQHLLALYQALLPTATLSQFTLPVVTLETPETLAQVYCPLWQGLDQAERAALSYVPVWQSHYPVEPIIDSPLAPFFTKFVAKIHQRLSEVVSQGQAEENVLRIRHHAQARQALIEADPLEIDTIKATGEITDPTDPTEMLAHRRQAHQAIDTLKQTQIRCYTPIAEMLVYLATHHSSIINHYAQSLSDAEQKAGDEKSAADTPPLHPARWLYRRLPKLFKPVYIQALIRQYQASSSPLSAEHSALVRQLNQEADESGWCYRQQQEAEQWQHDLHRLFALSDAAAIEEKSALPPVTLRFVVDGQIVQKHLAMSVIKQLLDEHGQWRAKEKHIGGRHAVRRVRVAKTDNEPERYFWFKPHPEQPATEYLVQRIDQLLGGFATPPHQFAKLVIGEQPPLSVLITQEVAPPTLNPTEDQNLAQVLIHHPERLAKLSPLSFVSTLLRVLVINPEDDKANDYFLVPDPDMPGYYRLIRIDNERAFFSPDQPKSSIIASRELNVKTIILCLEQMQMSWEALLEVDPRLNEYRAHIQHLVPAECFQDLLSDAADLHDHWCLLFSCAEVIQTAQAAIKTDEIVLPVMLILPDCEKAFLERLYLIQQAWHKSALTGLSLLDNVQPSLANYYRPLFAPESTPQSRFKAGPGQYYRRDEKGHLHTTISSLMSLSRQLNLPALLTQGKALDSKQELLKTVITQVWQRQAYSAAQALYGVGVWQQEKILGIENRLWITAGTPVPDYKASLHSPAALKKCYLLLCSTAPKDCLSLPDGIIQTYVRTGNALFYLHKRKNIYREMKMRSGTLARFDAALHINSLILDGPGKTLSPAEQKQITTITQQFPWLFSREEAVQLRRNAQLEFQLLPIADRTALMQRLSRLFAAGEPRTTPKKRQVIIQTTLATLAQAAVEQLSLMAWKEGLNDAQFIAIVQCAGRHLLSLDISHCTLLTPRVLNIVTTHCPNLRHLKAQALPWTEIVLDNAPSLIRLDLSQSKQLHTLTLRRLPQLKRLKLSGCDSLTILGNISGWIKPITTAYDLPQLRRLDIRDCRALTQIRLITQQLDSLRCDWAGCSSQILIDWTRFLCEQSNTKPAFLENIDRIIAASTWDLSELTLDSFSQAILFFLLRSNIPVTHLKITKQPEKLRFFSIKSEQEIFPSAQKIASSKPDRLIRIILIGDSHVGKSTLLYRLAHNVFLRHPGTVGVDLRISTIFIDNSAVKLWTWDTTGHERSRTITYSYYKLAHVIFICFDLTDKDSFEKVRDFHRGIEQHASEDVLKILVGLKADVDAKSENGQGRAVGRERAQDLADEYGMPYFECSAKTGEGVEEVFLGATLLAISQKKHFIYSVSTDKEDHLRQKVNTALLSLLSFTSPVSAYAHNQLRKDIPQELISNDGLINFVKAHGPRIKIDNDENRPINLEKMLVEALRYNNTLMFIDINPDLINEVEFTTIQQLLARNRRLAGIADDHKLPVDKNTLDHEVKSEIKLKADSEVLDLITLSSVDSEPVSPLIINDKAKCIQSDVVEAKELILSDSVQLSQFVQPLTEMNLDDEPSILQILDQLPPTLIAPFHEVLRDKSHQDLPDAKTRISGRDILKQLCLYLQNQQRNRHSIPSLSPGQAYIQSHPALQQYHDLFLQTLEFRIKAAVLGTTGRLVMTDMTDAVLSASGDILGAVPVIGGLFKAPVAASALANKIKMAHEDGRISQLFTGARSIETQVAQLAEQLTLTIRHELLEGKPETPKRQAALQEGGSYYKRVKSWLKQQKQQWINWQTLTATQKQALLDAWYLITKLPTLVQSADFRREQAGVPIYLKILLHDPQFQYDEKAMWASLPVPQPEEKEEKSDDQLARQHAKIQHYAAKSQVHLTTLRTQATQPLSEDHWQAMQTTLDELEVALLESQLDEEAAEESNALSQLLTDLFDRLQKTAHSENRRESSSSPPTEKPKALLLY